MEIKKPSAVAVSLIYHFRRAPFTYAAWKSPEFLARISQVAGIDLVPSIDFEIANINISIRDENANVEHTVDLVSDQDLPAVAWHYDSFPFVCVTMLSGCTGMVGGETALRIPWTVYQETKKERPKKKRRVYQADYSHRLIFAES
jgi:hypothetical protein